MGDIQLKLRLTVDTSAVDRAREELRKLREPEVLTWDELHRVGPGFEIRVPGFDLAE